MTRNSRNSSKQNSPTWDSKDLKPNTKKNTKESTNIDTNNSGQSVSRHVIEIVDDTDNITHLGQKYCAETIVTEEARDGFEEMESREDKFQTGIGLYADLFYRSYNVISKCIWLCYLQKCLFS